jgi:prepilin-type N-terminal cleavage/methylation domain-containing protein
MKHSKSGFTLIEVMLVTTIVGVLVATVLPVYRDYVNGTKISAVMSQLQAAKTEIILCYQTKGSITGCEPTLPSLENVDNLSVSNGVISIAFDFYDPYTDEQYELVFNPIIDNGHMTMFESRGNACENNAVSCKTGGI